ncbi:hypothetical protein [Candidatus Clostridium stratigraminis]|uniref:Uncharacterized protein n=1 Tax=Candidatus Clostridium stratigraminis TaxID=3381661 RepID=A0ABW8T6W6_9CLOT
MIKLKCKKCGQAWYTANTRLNQKCSECGGLLVEEELNFIRSEEVSIKPEPSKNCGPKVIHLNW